MEHFSKEILSVMQYLLPGFITAWVFYGLTSHSKAFEFERVIQALIFTLFVQAIIYSLAKLFLYIGAHYKAIAVWDKSAEVIWSVIIAILLGIVFSYLANNDIAHRLLRFFRITKETSYPSEWFGTFTSKITFIVLHFHDERRLYGWPQEWPSDPDNGHFLITDPSWLDGENENPIVGVDNILINVQDIKWVEFLEKNWEICDVEKKL